MDWNVLDAHEALQDERGHAVHGGPDQGVGASAQFWRHGACLGDVVEQSPEQGVHDAGGVERHGRDVSMPAEGHAEQVRMRDGECDVGTRGRGQARGRVIGGGNGGRRIGHRLLEHGEALQGHRRDQGVLVGEVVVGRARAYADLGCQGAQGQVLDADRLDVTDRRGEQSGAQIPVVVRALAIGHGASVADNCPVFRSRVGAVGHYPEGTTGA